MTDVAISGLEMPAARQINLVYETCANIRALQILPTDDLVEAINTIRSVLHQISPFKNEPVDYVKWVRADEVEANDYNPNSVAPPEMELLRLSIMADGYTQPIVANREAGKFVVIDGFHRNRVGKEVPEVRARIGGYLPVVQIRASQTDPTDRMASTIRHNRARGKHRVTAMSDIVIELKRRNWSNEKICKNLGMDKDEVLRLCQISGLIELFADQQFSQAWEAEGQITPDDFEEISGIAAECEDEGCDVRTANTDDPNRKFHTFDKWECHKAGFFASSPLPGYSAQQCREMYRDFLSDLSRFEEGLQKVTTEWPFSCEQNLTNSAMNRIAWLGQAAMCAMTGVPSEFRGGYFLLTDDQQKAADALALQYLNAWLVRAGMEPVPLEIAQPDRQADIY